MVVPIDSSHSFLLRVDVDSAYHIHFQFTSGLLNESGNILTPRPPRRKSLTHAFT